MSEPFYTGYAIGLDIGGTNMVAGVIAGEVRPQKDLTLVIHRASGKTEEVPVILRIDTPIEIDYYQHGGILPYVLRQILAGTTDF